MREPKRYIAIYDGDYIAPHKKEASDGPFLLADDPAIVQALALRGACEAAGLLDESGNLRRIVGTLSVTANGDIVIPHPDVSVWHPHEIGEGDFDFDVCCYMWCSPNADGGYTYRQYEVSECYSTREAAERAAKGGSDA